jgi:hypothetical protein
MEVESRNIQPTPATPGNAPKRAYNSPVLRVYGAVRQLTQGGGSAATFDGMSTMIKASDRALKTNLVRIGTHPLGIGLYLFDYKAEFQALAGRGRQFGVMADEVETVMPEAVIVHPDGYKRVNYAMLEIDLSGRCFH